MNINTITKQLSEHELDCIRFYMGDPEIVNRGDFRGGPKAYNTINALLHDGIQNEIDKIGDGKPIEIFDGEHLKSYMSLIATIYEVMQKYADAFKDSKEAHMHLTTYRVDRFSEVEPLLAMKKLEGFYSTCKYGYLEEYANTKSNIALFEIVRDKDVPYLDFEVLFEQFYAKPQEAEILLPFDTHVKAVEEISLSAEEKEWYRDINGMPPKGKYRIFVENTKNSNKVRPNIVENKSEDKDDMEDIEAIVREETIIRVQRCLEDLRNFRSLNREDLVFYVAWKRKVKDYVKNNLNLYALCYV